MPSITYQQDAYGFTQKMIIEEETVEERRWRLRKQRERKARARLAGLREQAEAMRSSGKYAHVEILGEDDPATAFIVCFRRDPEETARDMLLDAYRILKRLETENGHAANTV